MALPSLLLWGSLLPAQEPLPAPGAATGQASASGADPSPADLLRQAGQAIDANHLAEARAALDRLRTLNARQPGLWAAYAVLSLREKDPGTAVVDFRKELALHPDNDPVYSPLTAALVQLNRRPEALDAARAWAAVAPADPRPVGLEVNLLLDEGQNGKALEAGTAGLARLPESARHDPSLQYSLGLAELRAGDKAAGAKRLVQMLSGTDDSSVRNSIAYALADAGSELPTAEATARQAIERMELESEGWSLGGGSQPLQFGTPLLVAAWDTLGWALFREGKPAEAEPYIRAAWRNVLHGTVGEHLSEVEAALGRPAAAAADLQLAVAAAGAANPQSGVERAELAAMEARLKTVAAVERSGGHASAKRAGVGQGGDATGDAAASTPDLLRLRTFSLGPAGGRNGSATYAVLLARGKVVAAASIAGAGSALPGADALLAHANLSTLFPATGSFVQLVHLFVVSCAPKGCELVLQR